MHDHQQQTVSIWVPLMMFSGNPSVLQECRPATQQCVAPYDLPVTRGSEATLLACTSTTDNVCPMGAVPYREYNSTVPWALQQCRLNGTCNSITDQFGVPALTAAGAIVACLTLDSTPSSTAQQACPSVPGVDFPVEVTQAAPAGCGTVTSPVHLGRHSGMPFFRFYLATWFPVPAGAL
jgi:hypothetical protein